MARQLIAAWGVFGVCALLGQALWRLTPIALDAIESGLTTLQWAVLGVWVVAMAHSEGYKGFHQRFSPRVVARAHALASEPRPLFVALAPLFCMSLFHASRRGLLVARCVLGGVIVLIVLVRMLDQPWRGIVDAGVVVGLGIGTASLLYFYIRSLTGKEPPIEPDLPGVE